MHQHRVSVTVNKAGSKKAAGTISGAARSILKHFGGGMSFSLGYDQTIDPGEKGAVVTILIDGPEDLNDVAVAAAVKAVSECYVDSPNGKIMMYGGVQVGEYYTGDAGWSPDGWRPIKLQRGDNLTLEIRDNETGEIKRGKFHYDIDPVTKRWGEHYYQFDDGSRILMKDAYSDHYIGRWDFKEVRD